MEMMYRQKYGQFVQKITDAFSGKISSCKKFNNRNLAKVKAER